MPVESAADLAAFFNPDEFGELVRYRSPVGVETNVSALWDRPTRTAEFAHTDVNLDVHRFTLRRAELPAPETGGTITIVAGGDVYQVIHEPQTSGDGALWTLSAALVAA